MEIQSIDLFGPFTIQGITGSDGQILTFNESGGFEWGTASTGGGGGGSSESYFKTDGYNYVICETVNTGDYEQDANTNGNNLYDAYQLAKTLNIGLSITNRVSVLLMPGDYNLGQLVHFTLDTPYIDLVGITTNPYDTVLRSTHRNSTIKYGAPVDSKLKNVYIKPGILFSVDDDEGTGDGSYLRWENLILDGNCFSDGSYYGFQNIKGEFKDIVVVNDGRAFQIQNGFIDGIFDNIDVQSGLSVISVLPTSPTSSYSLTGTFSNISFSNFSTGLYSDGKISGNFKNIRSVSSIFSASYSIEGKFENIESNGNVFQVTEGGHISGEFSNIRGFGDSFNSIDYIDGVFKDIYLTGITQSHFFTTSATISGTFSDLNFVGSIHSIFTEANVICGNYKNIRIEGVTDDVFSTGVELIATQSGLLFGEFRDIEIGSIGYKSFYADNYLEGIFENININILDGLTASLVFSTWVFDGLLYPDCNLSGTFSDIVISGGISNPNYIFTSFGTFSGNFDSIKVQGSPSSFVFRSFNMSNVSCQNLEVDSSAYCFYSNGVLDGIFKGINIGETLYAFRTDSAGIVGTISNLTIISATSAFYANGFIQLDCKDLEVGQVDQIFYAANSIDGNYENIRISDSYGNCFVTQNSYIIGNFCNIDAISTRGPSYFIYNINGAILSGTFSNITAYGFTVSFDFSSISANMEKIRVVSHDVVLSGNLGFGNYIIDFMGDRYVPYTFGTVGFNLQLNGSSILRNCRAWDMEGDILMDHSSGINQIENCSFLLNNALPGFIRSTGLGLTDIPVIYTRGLYWDGGNKPIIGDLLLSPNYNTSLYAIRWLTDTDRLLL